MVLAKLRILGLAAAVLLLAVAPPRTVLYGYTPPASNRERDFEASFLDVPSAQGALDVATVVAQHPHYAGSPGDRDLAIYMRDKLREYGFDADLETLTAQVETPKKLSLTLIPNEPAVATPEPEATPTPGGRRGKAAPLPKIAFRLPRRARGPARVELDLRELPIPGDEGTANIATLPFNAGSADGTVTATLVYAGHGLDGDYAELARHNVDIHGAVVLIRYGAQFRGSLALRAQRRGAAGVIFYNDPADDGFARGPVYPAGPWRPPTAVERGTVGAGIRIPTLPISAANAQLLLAALRGPEGPKPWSGALPVAYPYARGPAQVRLSVSMNRRTATLWNTIGRIRGTHGEQYVLLGAHRDAWVTGVGGNGSGISTLLELARGYGFLLKSGWHPLRTIIVAGWDGEELGSIGSIAYVKRHREELVSGGVAYLNADEAVVGPRFTADAAAAIAPAVADAARSIEDPVAPSRSVFDQWAAESKTPTPTADAPGGGSDHASFLFDVGTPVANLSFTGPFGAYHSGYDTLQFATTISDPGFVRHRAAAQLYGLLAMRLAGSEAVPYEFAAYVPLLHGAIAALTQRATTTRTPVDLSALQATVETFASTATRYDALTARAANVASSDRSLEAARVLDLATYSADGFAASIFPDLDRALTGGDAGAFAAAVTRTRSAIAHANDLLAGAPGMEIAPPPPPPTVAPRRPPPRRAPPHRRP